MKTSMHARWRRMLPLGLLALAAVTSLSFTACTPNSGITVQESDVVATYYDTAIDFGAINTYAMPDSIFYLEGTDTTLINRDNDEAILDLIAANFQSRGYDRLSLDSETEPDVAVIVRAVAVENYALYSYNPWWGWGYPGWGWGGGWYYPSYGASYAFSSGTLFVDMGDPDEAGPDNLIPGIWTAAANGVLDDTSANKRRRLTDSINQMFIQSPYLESKD